MKQLQLFLYCTLEFSTEQFESLFNNVLGRYGIIFYDVGWCGGLNKGGNIIDDVGIGFCNNVDGMETKCFLIQPMER